MAQVREVSPLFQKIKEAKGADSKKARLAEALTDETAKVVINGAFHPAIKFHFIHAPVYTSIDLPEEQRVTIRDFTRYLYLWVEGSRKTPEGFTQQQRDQKLREALEAMTQEEGELLIAMLSKNLSSYGITKEMVDSVMPGLTE